MSSPDERRKAEATDGWGDDGGFEAVDAKLWAALASSPDDPNAKLAGAATEPQVGHNSGSPDEGGERR